MSTNEFLPPPQNQQTEIGKTEYFSIMSMQAMPWTILDEIFLLLQVNIAYRRGKAKFSVVLQIGKYKKIKGQKDH